jgi:hypothetical protein
MSGGIIRGTLGNLGIPAVVSCDFMTDGQNMAGTLLYFVDWPPHRCALNISSTTVVSCDFQCQIFRLPLGLTNSLFFQHQNQVGYVIGCDLQLMGKAPRR